MWKGHEVALGLMGIVAYFLWLERSELEPTSQELDRLAKFPWLCGLFSQQNSSQNDLNSLSSTTCETPGEIVRLQGGNTVKDGSHG